MKKNLKLLKTLKIYLNSNFLLIFCKLKKNLLKFFQQQIEQTDQERSIEPVDFKRAFICVSFSITETFIYFFFSQSKYYVTNFFLNQNLNRSFMCLFHFSEPEILHQ